MFVMVALLITLQTTKVIVPRYALHAKDSSNLRVHLFGAIGPFSGLERLHVIAVPFYS